MAGSSGGVPPSCPQVDESSSISSGDAGRPCRMDHSRAPVLEALLEFRRRGDVVYGPPGHKQGRGADPRVVEVVGEGVFASDVLTLNGLDDRRESQSVLEQAQEL